MGGSKKSDIPETAEQQELAKVASEKWNMFETNLKPVRTHFINEMLDNNNVAKYEDLAESVSTDAAVMLDREAAGAAESLASQGVDPTSGRYQASMGKVASDSAVVTADTVNRAQSAQQTNYLQGLSNVVAMGEKKSMQATQGLSDVAANSVDSAMQSAQNKANSRSATKTGLGIVAGAGYDMASKGKDGKGG